MDTKNKNRIKFTIHPGQSPSVAEPHFPVFSLSRFLTFSFSHLPTSPPAHLLTCKAFTLLELLAVAAILALAAAVATPIFFDKTDQTHFQSTVDTMAEIEKAILGVTSDRVRGDVRFAGYVQDMGGLPELFYVTKKGKIIKVKEDEKISDILKNCKYPPQPKGLWTNDPNETPENENDDLFSYKRYSFGTLEYIRVGWRGPYLKPSLSGALEDGWGNAFVFENIDGDFVIISLGADNKEGGEGFDRDIANKITKLDYTGSVSGYVSPQSVFWSIEEMGSLAPGYGLPEVDVRIYYTPATSECEPEEGYAYCEVIKYVKYIQTTADPDDGYFHFNSVPIGTDRILWTGQNTRESHQVGIGYKLAVEQGAIWLGTLGEMP